MSLTTLFIDMNAYFASVEQQERPELRHRPVAVVPMMTDNTCCIAASYEAKRFGIKTGTQVGMAKRRCADLRIVEARPDVYVEFHHAIIAAVESCLHVESIHSIDEMSCRLMGREREPQRATEIARRIKAAIRREVGEYVRCSIGLAPNRFLAKVASDMQKPDGLVVIASHALPERLYGLDLMDLPGIGPRMRQRLHLHGIETVEQLCALSEEHLRNIWHSVLAQVRQLEIQIGLGVVPGAVCVQSRDYICSTSSTVRNRCGKVKPRRWSSTFRALSGVVTHRSRM